MHLRSSLACLCLAFCLLGQGDERLTLEALGHPTLKKTFAGTPQTRLEWLPDGALLETRREGELLTLLRVEPATWTTKPLMEAERLLAALTSAGASDGSAKAALARGSLIWNQARSAFLLRAGDDHYLVDVEARTARRLVAGRAEEATFSPDGRQVAFLRGNDLYRVEVATARETRLTTGGGETLLNGRLDWVYQEEVYGRGSFRAYWWAPDSSRIAYLSLDEARVPVFTLLDDRSQPQKSVAMRYPKAGEPNPSVRLGVVDLQGQTVWTEDPHAGRETLVSRVAWDPLGRLVAIYTDRTQTWLELRRFEGTRSKVLLREQGRAWQDPHRQEPPVFLKDGGFLWESCRTGRRHIYRFDAEGGLKKALTTGDWDVRKLHGVDEDRGLVHFDASKQSPTATHAYRVGLDGLGLTRITEARGTHRVRWNGTFSVFLDTWSSLEQPARQALFDADGRQLRLIDANPSPGLQRLKLGTVRLQQVWTRDGFPLETMLILPPDLQPGKKYPVFQHVYGGPGGPVVNDAFGRGLLWYHFLAQNGIIVWLCDNRSATDTGLAGAERTFGRLGSQELEDQLDGLKWLGQQGFADLSRVCIEGWSYGGYMAAYAMTHSSAFKLGIIGAPVTDFALYDSIYTERYMGLPAANRSGYEGTNLAAVAKHLSGRPLIVHGMLDDNVHVQHTLRFIDALHKAGKDYDLRLYPGSDHGSAFADPWQNWDMMRVRWEFISRNL